MVDCVWLRSFFFYKSALLLQYKRIYDVPSDKYFFYLFQTFLALIWTVKKKFYRRLFMRQNEWHYKMINKCDKHNIQFYVKSRRKTRIWYTCISTSSSQLKSFQHFHQIILLIKMCLHDEFGSRNNHPLSNVCFSQEVYTYLIKLKCSFRTVTPVKCFVMNGHIRICDICYNKVNFNNVMNFVMEHFCKCLPSTKSVLDEERYLNLVF